MKSRQHHPIEATTNNGPATAGWTPHEVWYARIHLPRMQREARIGKPVEEPMRQSTVALESPA